MTRRATSRRAAATARACPSRRSTTTDAAELRALIAEHRERTGSAVADRLLADWETSLARFVKVMPNDYRRVLNEQAALAGELAEVGA